MPKKAPPKLPVKQFIVLAICRFAEPLAMTSVFPYLPEMIHSLGVPQKDVSTWVGVTSAAFSGAQFLTGVPWVWLSDRVGRKPVVLTGFLMTMIFTLAFGFSRSLAMVILTRTFLGLGNGNVGIIRTMVAEMVPQRELQPRAFSIMPLVWTIGSIFGPSIGGALVNPAERLPKWFGSSKFFQMYPYALPNLFVSVFFIFGVSIGFLFLKETLEVKKDRRDYGLVLGEILARPCSGRRLKRTKKLPADRPDERSPLLSNNGVPERAKKQDKISSKTESLPPSWSQILIPQSLLLLLAYTLLGLQNMAYDSMFPVFLNYPASSLEDSPEVRLPLKFTFGLGMDSRAIGILYTFNGIIGMFMQFVTFPYCANRFGILVCLKVACAVLPMTYFLVPFSALLPTEPLRLGSAFVLNFLKLGGVIYAYPCMIILLTNSAPNLRVLGTLNGIATSLAALGRAIGPGIMGAIFTFGLKQGYMIIPWFVLAVLSILSALPLLWIVEPPGRPEEEESDDLDIDDDDDDENDTYDNAFDFDDESESYENGTLPTRPPDTVECLVVDGYRVTGSPKVDPKP